MATCAKELNLLTHFLVNKTHNAKPCIGGLIVGSVSLEW